MKNRELLLNCSKTQNIENNLRAMLASYASGFVSAVKNTVVTAAVITTEVVKPALNRVLPERALPPLEDVGDVDDVDDDWMDKGVEDVIKALHEAAAFKERRAQESASLDAVKTALTSTVELAPVAPVDSVELAPVESDSDDSVELAPDDSDDESDYARDPMNTAGFLQPNGMLTRDGTLIPWLAK